MSITRQSRARPHKRPSKWPAARSLPMQFGEELILPTGVTPGAPGSFTPVGAELPESIGGLRFRGALGETAAWTVGQYVVLDDASHAYWDGDSWEVGEAPA
jgi:hypothetical protein